MQPWGCHTSSGLTLGDTRVKALSPSAKALAACTHLLKNSLLVLLCHVPSYYLLAPLLPGSTAEAARIIYPPEAQTIIVTKGQSLILECVASGIPPPRVTWAKDGSSVSAYNKTRFLLSNLLIDPTSEEDSGTYSCTADNGVGEAGAAFIFYNVQVFGECSCSSCFRRGGTFSSVFREKY